MTGSKLPTVVATVIAVFVAGYLVVQLRAERQTVAQLQARAASLELAQRNITSTARTLAPQPESPTPAAAPATTPAPLAASEAAAGAQATKTAPAPPRQQIVVMRADGTPDPDPTAGARTFLKMWYGDVEKELDLTAEQMNALIQLTARGNATPAEHEAVLGPKYPQFREIGQERALSSLVENRVTSLQRQLSSSTQPLTDQQSAQLRNVLTAEHRRRDQEIATHPKPTEPRALLDYEEQRLRITEASDERLIAAARSHLGAEQVAVMQGMLSMLSNSQRRTLEARRARLEAGGSGAADPPAPLYIYPQGTLPPGMTPAK